MLLVSKGTECVERKRGGIELKSESTWNVVVGV